MKTNLIIKRKAEFSLAEGSWPMRETIKKFSKRIPLLFENFLIVSLIGQLLSANENYKNCEMPLDVF